VLIQEVVGPSPDPVLKDIALEITDITGECLHVVFERTEIPILGDELGKVTRELKEFLG